MKKKLTIVGALVGCLCGIGAIIASYVESPGRPGFYEVLIQLLVALVLAAPVAGLGFLVGWFVDRFRAKNEKA